MSEEETTYSCTMYVVAKGDGHQEEMAEYLYELAMHAKELNKKYKNVHMLESDNGGGSLQ